MHHPRYNSALPQSGIAQCALKKYQTHSIYNAALPHLTQLITDDPRLTMGLHLDNLIMRCKYYESKMYLIHLITY